MAMPQDKLFATQAECLYNLGKTHEAYSTMKAAYQKADSLKQSDIDKQLSQFNVKYKTLEKEVQIEKMNHEQSLLYIRILCLTIAIIILLIAILIILYRRKLDKQRAELTEKTSYINGVETERKRLAKGTARRRMRRHPRRQHHDADRQGCCRTPAQKCRKRCASPLTRVDTTSFRQCLSL